MRVAIVTTSYPLHSGQAAGHFVAAEARALCAQGHQVTVIAPGPRTVTSGFSPSVVRISGGGLFGPPGAMSRLRSNPLRAAGGLRFMFGARAVLARGRFDRVIGHWLIPCVWPLGLGRAADVEGVLHGSDVRLFAALPRALRQHIAARLLESRVALRCVSEHLRDALLAAAPLPLAPLVRVEPVLLEMDPLCPSAEDSRRAARSAGERLIVIVARLVASKRVNVALDAVVALPNARVVVVGDGPLRSALQQAFPDVLFTGELSRPEALGWVARADVLISASRLEGSPLVVREARALGVPVIACAAGDLQRWALEDAELWVVPPASELESA